MPLARLVDGRGPSVVVRARAEAEAELDLPRGAVALGAVANDSSSAQAAVVEPHELALPRWVGLEVEPRAVQ